MKKKSSNSGILLLIAVILVILILGALYYITKSENVKECQDEFKDRAEKIKRQIIEKENNISALILEIQSLKAFDKFLIAQANEIYKAAKLVIILILISACLISYAVMNFNLIESLMTIGTFVVILYHSASFYFHNRAGDINRTLRLIHNYFISRLYKRHCFDPAYINMLGEKLANERNELEQLKLVYIEIEQ